MKEQLDTIPVNEAFETDCECPFCALERTVEQKAIRYTLGPSASYMEPDVRAATDSAGFCRVHYKKMYDYGNSLGNALIMQTYMVGLQKELEVQTAAFEAPAKRVCSPKSRRRNCPFSSGCGAKTAAAFCAIK